MPDWAVVASAYWTAQGVSIATQQAVLFIGCVLVVWKSLTPRKEDG